MAVATELRKRKRDTEPSRDDELGNLDGELEVEGDEDALSEEDGEPVPFPELNLESDSGGEDSEADSDDDDDESDEQGDETEDDFPDDGIATNVFPKARTIISDITGQPKRVYPEIEPEYDSDSSTEDAPNRVGNIPMHWYDDLPHVGYDINGKQVLRPAKGDELDKFLATVEDPDTWTSAFDKSLQTDKPLTTEELDLIRRLHSNEVPDANYDPYEPTIEWFTGKGKEEIMPLSAAPEPKRRWLPSKWEKQKVMKIVRAIREGRILPNKPKASTEPQFYSLWAAPSLSHPPPLPAPKPRLPTHSESYNPPAEYLPTPEEKKAWEDTDKGDRERDYLPQKHSALRLVPAYDNFIQERFDRLLDLYLAPRIQRKKLAIDPSSMIPSLPSPQSLKPFPAYQAIKHQQHGTSRVRCITVSPGGEWIASGDESGLVCITECTTGHEAVRWNFQSKIGAVAWCPRSDVAFLAVGVEDTIYFLLPPHISPLIVSATKKLLDPSNPPTVPPPITTAESPVKWTSPSPLSSSSKAHPPILSIALPSNSGLVKQIVFHRRGDYFASVSGGEGQGAVWIHQTTKRYTQSPFKKIKGAVQCVLFHPMKPRFFVATQRYVRIYDLSQQKLIKTLQPGIRWISSLDVHPSGDHLIVGGYDRKLCWFDLELSEKPYKVLKYHTRAIRSLDFHPTYPLFASSSDDGSIQVFHARVFSDLMTDPLIVPLKILRGHEVKEGLGVLAIKWVQGFPWLVSAGADGGVGIWSH